LRDCPRRHRSANSDSGSATLVVLALLASMALMFYANSRMVHLLKTEILMIDKEQLKKYGQGARD